MTSFEAGPLAGFIIGEGRRSVVLLHGFLGSGRNLRSLAQRWSERQVDRRFLVPDLSGHGGSPPLPADFGLDDAGRAVLETAENAGFAAPLTLVGHSLGGRVALAAARVAPERLASVALLDIGPGAIDPGSSESRRVLDVLLAAPAEIGDRREMRSFLLDRGLQPALTDWLLLNLRSEGPRWVWRIDHRALDRVHDRFNREDLWSVVDARRVPIRCVRGGRSRYVGDADVARLRAAGCAVDTLPEAGHFVHVDALETLLDLLCGTRVT